MDSDDFLDLEALKRMVEISNCYDGADIVRCGIARYSEKGEFIYDFTGIQIGIDEKLNGLSGIDYLSKIPLMYFSPSTSSLIKIKLLKENDIFFIENAINEDLAFAFKIYIKAQKICFIAKPFYAYRARFGSISCIDAFLTHSKELLYRSYKANFDYLASLLLESRYKKINNLIIYNLRECAQMPVLCWIRDRKLCTREELRPLVPFMKFKTKIAYSFPTIARVGLEIKEWIKKCIKKS